MVVDLGKCVGRPGGGLEFGLLYVGAAAPDFSAAVTSGGRVAAMHGVGGDLLRPRWRVRRLGGCKTCDLCLHVPRGGDPDLARRPWSAGGRFCVVGDTICQHRVAKQLLVSGGC